MVRLLVLVPLATLLLSGCDRSRLTGYNLKGSVGQTDYQDGNRSLYTGASVDAHFDVSPPRH